MKSKAKKNGHRPGRGTKGPHNPILPPELQGRSYVVKAFIVTPRITLLDADGKEEVEALGPQFGMFESQMGDTIPQFMEKRGVKLRSDVK